MKPAFPSVYSTLCPVALSDLITEKYTTGKTTCKFLVRGVGDTYLVESSTDRFILRVYRTSHRSHAQISAEIELLLALKNAGVSVSYPIADVLGNIIQKIDAAEGERYAVLFSYAPGQVVKALSDAQLGAFGQEIAKFHVVSSTLQLGDARWNFDLESTLFAPLEKLKPAFSEDPESYTWLQGIVQQATKKLSQPETLNFAKGYCHFDFLPKNVHFEQDTVTLFDFDFMGYGWLVNDIMSFWQHLMLEVFTARMTQQTADEAYQTFLKGYREYRSLGEQELDMVPYLSLWFWLFYMGFHTTHDQFYAFSQPAQLKAYTGILKHIVASYWEKEENLLVKDN